MFPTNASARRQCSSRLALNLGSDEWTRNGSYHAEPRNQQSILVNDVENRPQTSDWWGTCSLPCLGDTNFDSEDSLETDAGCGVIGVHLARTKDIRRTQAVELEPVASREGLCYLYHSLPRPVQSEYRMDATECSALFPRLIQLINIACRSANPPIWLSKA